MIIIRCKKCNSIIDDNSTFCKYCGEKIEVDDIGINYSPVYNIEHDMKYTLDCTYYGTYELTSDANVLLLKVEKFEAKIEVENEMTNEFVRFLKEQHLSRFNEEEFNLLINEGSFSCEYHQYKYWYANLYFEDMSFNYYPKFEE